MTEWHPLCPAAQHTHRTSDQRTSILCAACVSKLRAPFRSKFVWCTARSRWGFRLKDGAISTDNGHNTSSTARHRG